jgi:FtsH-binding integral membrane protein
MSYGLEYAPVAARAEPSARAAFIRRTYGHLAGAVLVFAILEVMLLQLLKVQEVQQTLAGLAGTGRGGMIILLIGFIGVSYLANYWAQSNASPVLQYAGLGLYVAAQAVIFLPLMWYVTTQIANGNEIIAQAGVLTLAIFGGLTAAVFITRRDYSYLRSILVVGTFIALGVIIAGWLFGFSLGLFFCFAMVALASGYIVYYTSNILHHYRTNQHVAASLALFASVALLFFYILRILASRRG